MAELIFFFSLALFLLLLLLLGVSRQCFRCSERRRRRDRCVVGGKVFIGAWSTRVKRQRKGKVSAGVTWNQQLLVNYQLLWNAILQESFVCLD